MDFLRTLLSRIAALLGCRHRDIDLDDDIAAHLDLLIQEHIANGMSAADARTAALRSFGGVTQTRETYRIERGFPRLEQFGRDLRYASRQLRRSPGFTLTAVLTLALGLGANIAVFSLLNCLLLRPLPVPHADELAVISIVQNNDEHGPNYSFSSPFLRSLEKHHDGFDSIAGFSTRPFQVRDQGSNVRVPGAMVSGQFFSMLETPPSLGRLLTPQDDREGQANVAVISDSYWKTRFHRDPAVIRQTLTIANQPFTIVGVLPSSFTGADPTYRPEIYVPAWAEPIIDAPYNAMADGYHSWWMRMLGRRAPSISLEKANAALASVSNPVLDESIPDAKWIKDARSHHFRFAAEPGSRGWSFMRDTFRKPLVVVFVLCSAMLLLACINLASLLMARAAARERELATRLAMGASRMRLIQQLLVESLLISVLGTATGLIAAPAVSRSLATVLIGNAGDFIMLDTSLDMRVLAFVALIAILSTLLVGLVPALRATSKGLNEQIKSGTQSVHARQHRLLPRLLMSTQVALALILVTGAGLLATSLQRLHGIDIGFQPEGLVNVSLQVDKQSRDGDALVAWYRQYLDGLARLPGVKALAYVSFPPMSGAVWTEDMRSSISNGDQNVYMNCISSGYFTTLKIPILAGRDFRWSDTSPSGLKIILSEAAAQKLFPGQNAIGQSVTQTDSKETKKVFQVIGVVGGIHYVDLREKMLLEAYVPLTQNTDHKPSYVAVARVDGSAVPLATAARQLAANMAPEIPAPVLTPMMMNIDGSIASERMMAMLAVFFAICALLVTAIGLYGTLAYSTARRTSEIGVRMALGAQPAQVVSLVFRENAWIAVYGSLAGLIVAWFAARALTTLLYNTSARDPWVLIASVALLIAIASAASLVPAIRAARVDPSTALRAE
ncbi:ABC transporter permease [Occallatibacter savannae]|uniref:ABC transporter permease n=1 Tax=Occallatibacter savannae TaxID=1002691 RepID=UPI000D693143|nr:ABC transporter permease [Occallatibacter savannae]